MRPHINKSQAQPLIWTAPQTNCDVCGHSLAIAQHRRRYVIRLDGVFYNIRRDKHCTRPGCPGAGQIYRPLEDIRLALPYMNYGLDVVLRVGEEHVHNRQSLRQIGRDMAEQGVDVDQSHVGKLLRAYLAVCEASQDKEALEARLVKQGGIVVMVDGVQYDNRSPVLYVAWDALSGTVLDSERQEFRGQRDLQPLLQRVKERGVPIRGVVTDKDKGLVPAVEKVFPGVPHQLCQTHFLKNCAAAMEPDLKALGQSVERRAEKVREVHKRMHKAEQKQAQSKASEASADRGGHRTEPPPPESLPPPQEPPAAQAAPERTEPAESTAGADPPKAPAPVLTAESDRDLATEFCALVRANARVSGRAILAPAQMERHHRLEQIRQGVDAARKKRPRPRRYSMPSPSR